MATEFVLEADGLRRDFGRDENLVRAVDAVDLTVRPGEAVAVVGPSGCGKSTLLHLLGGLDHPTAGEVRIDGQSLQGASEKTLARIRQRCVGFVFQAFHLFDELTAAENVEVPALLAGESARTARRRALDLLDQVGLADRATHLPAALSGGQRQRVAVARAMANQPRVILADEPTGNLDSRASTELLRLFGALRAEGQALVIVTHDGSVSATADRVVSLRDGRIVDDVRMRDATDPGSGSGPLVSLFGSDNGLGREVAGHDA